MAKQYVRACAGTFQGNVWITCTSWKQARPCGATASRRSNTFRELSLRFEFVSVRWCKHLRHPPYSTSNNNQHSTKTMYTQITYCSKLCIHYYGKCCAYICRKPVVIQWREVCLIHRQFGATPFRKYSECTMVYKMLYQIKQKNRQCNVRHISYYIPIMANALRRIGIPE
jgi:hypothetical protein